MVEFQGQREGATSTTSLENSHRPPIRIGFAGIRSGN